MLQPTNRLTLIDAMRPPVGFRFESAVAVTFTLNLQALLAAPAALAFAESSDTSGRGPREPSIELLHALRSHASKLTVFSQVGEIALPRSHRVFAFLERAIVPVVAPRGGIVHPKVWVLRYEAVGKRPESQPPEQRLRVLITSRNLTFDESWDTVVRLDEAEDPAGAVLAPVGDLFEGLLENRVGTASTAHQNRVRSLSEALQTARFARPEGVDNLQIHVLGLTRTRSPLPETVERSLIISPFVSDDFFTRVHPAQVGKLVSRPESLDLLRPDTLENVVETYAFDDGSAPDLAADEERLSPLDPGRPLVGLHAKVFAFENEGRAHIFLGSANATGAAFDNNVEILVELIGSAAVLGIDRLCDGTDDEPGIRALFTDYHRAETSDETGGTSLFDRARRAIAGLRFEGSVEESGTGWAITYRSEESMPVLDHTEIHCWPLSSAGHRRRVAGGEPFEVRFETSLEAISGFLAFELTDREGGLTEFAVPVPLTGMPENRDRSLLRLLIGSAERFLRYLLALLNEDAEQMGLRDAIDRVSTDAGAEAASTAHLPVLEKLLRTMRRDPAKLDGLHPLVSDLATDNALPEGFAEFWRMIHDVAATEAAAQ